MTPLLVLTLAGLAIAGANAALGLRNLGLYRRSASVEGMEARARERVSSARLAVCIPARNEEENIEACVRAVLSSEGVDLRVVVYDDGSTDGTAEALERLAGEDERLVVAPRRSLPAGWNGKQHGCARCAALAFGLASSPGLAEGAAGVPADGETEAAEAGASCGVFAGGERATHVLFIDADVRLTPDAAARALGEFARRSADVESSAIRGCAGFGLLSTFPRQRTGTLSEALVVPLIFFLLLSYLPFRRMRETLAPAASAACGQFILVCREAYIASGGHSSFASSMHDGIKMPRAVRRAGYMSDIFDGADVASVRMYQGFEQTWRGFTKNAFEGLGSVALLVFLTVMNLLGHVAPPLVVVLAPVVSAVSGAGLPVLAWFAALAATLLPVVQRVVTADRLEHAATGALLHPVGVTLMAAIQWRSFYLHVTGKRSWRGRVESAGSGRMRAA